MKGNFISKLETEDYYIGSFDAYYDESLELLMQKENIKEEEAKKELQKLPTAYRAAIVRKKYPTYAGFIGIKDYNIENANLVVWGNHNISKTDLYLVQKEYLKYLKNSLNIQSKIILPKRCLKGIPTLSETKEVLEWYNLTDLKLAYQQSIYIGDKFFGIMGLTNVLWNNRRANLNIY